uniref:N-acetyltransferase domain-containing protein n=1 Tax=Rhabditophanes sp. KR3021 TaxID=114890 RepID=A0AC35TTW6_9BILA
MFVSRFFNLTRSYSSIKLNQKDLKIRLSTYKDSESINTLIYKDFLQNEPIVNTLHMDSTSVVPLFKDLLTSPFAKDYSVVCVNEKEKVIGCIITSLVTELPQYAHLVNIHKPDDCNSIVDKNRQTLLDMLLLAKQGLDKFKPKGTKAVLRFELAAVPPRYGGNGICKRMICEGLPLIIEKIPEIKFSIAEATNTYSLHALTSSGYCLGPKILFSDHGVEKSENGTDFIGGCYKIFN